MLNFIKYNNLVPITLSFILLGAGGALAASPEVRDAAAAAILSQEQQVVSVDNTYIVGKDLSGYTPQVRITGVTEDEENYYVAYSLTTIDIVEYVWQDVVKDEMMRVSKPDLGPYRDLGVYVTQQLRQIIDRELAYLGQVQEKERRAVSLAVVSTTYGGLIGKLLDGTTEALPGYVPVVTPPVADPSASPVAGQGSARGAPAQGGGGSSSIISLQVLGNNPARVPLRASYVDLGAVLHDPRNTNVGVHIFLNGHETVSPNIDTSTSSVHIIEYHATDPNGTTIMVRRIVLVGDVVDPGGEISSSGTATPAPVPAPEPASPAPESAPAPEPEPPPVPSAGEGEPAPTPAPKSEEPVAQEPAPASSAPEEAPIASTTPTQ